MRITSLAALFAALFFSSASLAQNKLPKEIPVEEFGALQKNSLVRISPDGKHFAILSFIDGVRYVVITPFGQPAKEVIPPYKGMRIGQFRWANNDTLLIEMQGEKAGHSALGKLTVNRWIIYYLNGKKPKNMAKPAKVKGSRPGDVQTAEFARVVDILFSDPENILIELDEDGRDMSLEVRRVNVRTGNYKLEMDLLNDVQNWMTDQDGELRLAEGIRRVGAGRKTDEFVMYYRNPEKENWIEYTDTDAGGYGIAGFFEDPRFAYAFGRNEEGYRVLYKYDMVNQEEVEVLFSVEGYDVGGLIRDKVTGKPVGVGYTKIKPQHYYFDKELGKIQRMMDKALPGNVNTLGSWTEDRKIFIVHSTSDIDPGAYFLFNNETKQLGFIEASYEGLDPNLLAPVKPVTYEANDGLEIPAYLTLPIGVEAKNLPTVILPHGGPQGRDVWGYDMLSQFLASRGYAVLQPNFRGSIGYGKEFADLGRREWGLKMQDDVTDAANWMVAQGIANPQRICILGWSYGGYAALTATIKTPDLFKCSISINGISDLSMLMYDDSNFLGLQNWGTHIGDPGEDKAKLRDASAYYNIDMIRTPVLVIVTRDDTRVNYNQSKKFAAKMKDEGKWVKYVEIKEGGHSALEGDGRTVILREIEKFLKQFIGN